VVELSLFFVTFRVERKFCYERNLFRNPEHPGVNVMIYERDVNDRFFAAIVISAMLAKHKEGGIDATNMNLKRKHRHL